MDWDVEPTAFSEWVTIQGISPQLLFDSDDGFASSDPLSGPSDIDSETSCGTGYTGPCQFTDLGSGGSYPSDTAPRLALSSTSASDSSLPGSRGRSTSTTAPPTARRRRLRRSAPGAQVYSLAESNCTGDTIATCFSTRRGNAGVEQGKPATFMFGFDIPEPDTVIDQPDTVIDGLTVSGNSVEGTFHGVWQNPELAVRVLRCQIDDQPWTVCTSPKSYGGLLAGDHVLRVTAVEDGLWDQTPAERTFTIPSEPETVIDGLTVSGNSFEATFHGVMQNPESAVRVLRCQIDDQPGTVCTSRKTYGGLLAADHVLRVTAVEDGLWDQTPAERTFTIASEPSPDLVPIDGGPGYYGQFSNPLPTDPSYFPIGVWLESGRSRRRTWTRTRPRASTSTSS